MDIQTLHIFPGDPQADLTCYLQSVPADTALAPRPAVIVCPGGGYAFLSPREDEPVALAWLAEGYQVFVLHYGVGNRAAHFAPLVEACLSVRYLREHAGELDVNPNKILMLGFSAGAHCAASSGVLFDRPEVRAAFGDAPTSLGKPDGLILSYPVITSGEYAHRGSILALCGDANADTDTQAEFSLENFVTDTTPPTFLWHTSTDKGVPVQNSLLFASALAAHHIPFELHVFPEGPHGLSLCDGRTSANPALHNPVAAEWLSLAICWADRL